MSNTPTDDDQDRLYLDLKGALERICRAQVNPALPWPEACRRRLDGAAEVIKGIGAFLPQWSKDDLPEIPGTRR